MMNIEESEKLFRKVEIISKWFNERANKFEPIEYEVVWELIKKLEEKDGKK